MDSSNVDFDLSFILHFESTYALKCHKNDVEERICFCFTRVAEK